MPRPKAQPINPEALRQAGWTLTPPRGRQIELASFREVARVLSVSIDWVRSHRHEIGQVMELPGGVLRLRWADVEAAQDRWEQQRGRAAAVFAGKEAMNA